MSDDTTLDIAAGFVRPNLTASVAEHLRRVIRRPGFGKRLPGEREIEERLGVSRSIVRAALSQLEAENHIRRRHGRATLVVRSESGN